ncbi:hypothetical protein [Citrobacter freundii]|uniref:hypothetical protein n=2 Tax=Citrobacter freundii TaxID=546 RepID=UPI0013D7C373|nr:hypothetical protein [Citrobacter freundii]EJD6097064.1 hypothetical protein [Citrobacter freundii]EKS9220769.1 hypothetical protein [Citrobacter freundii]EKX9189925.1 hypothetical protein [Citrobacter freundii]MBJ8813351.1 hypothetical protein [Citrobacter freundii]MBJ8912845.1 hypothetical protein [Citrobacter freundii]
MNVYEMEGFLRGKCLPGDMKVNESDAQYLVRKFSELQSQNAELAVQLANAESKCRELAAESAGMKSNLMYWNSEDAEPARSPLDIAHESSFGEGVEFDVQVAARMPSMTYRVVRRTTYSTEIELVSGGIPETPATDAFLAEVRAQARNELIDELESRFNEMTETLPPELRSGAAGAAAFVSTLRKGAAL